MAPKTDVGFVCYTPECLKPVFLCPVCDSHHSDVDLLRDHLASHEINSNKVSFPVKAQWFRSITDDSRDSTWLFVDIPLDEYLKYTTDRLEKCLRGEGVVVNVPIKTELSEELLDTDYHENDMDDENDEDGEEDGGDDEDYMEEEDEDEEEEEEDSRLKDEDDQSPSPVAGPSGTSTNPPDTTNTTSTSLENSETTVLRPRKRGRPRKSQTTKESREAFRTCVICNKKYAELYMLLNHMESKHHNVRYPCEVCDKKFSHQTSLRRHVLAHETELPFKCTICGKGFNRKEPFNRHVLRHTDSRPFQCTQCDKGFRARADLKRHIGVCGKKRMFACKICDAKYKSDRYLLEHHSRAHSGNRRTWPCEKCGKQFLNKSSVYVHNKNVACIKAIKIE